MDPTLDMVRRFMEETVPFNRYLGIRVASLEQGRVRLELPFRPELIGDPMRPALHGGVISSLLDTCGGASVWTRITPTDRVSTIDLRVDYLRPGSSELLVAEARVLRIGHYVGVTEIKAFHPSAPNDLIATGTGVYNIRRAERS
ncbi:MAG: thioesterase family protein [Polyangiaceae bacterium]